MKVLLTGASGMLGRSILRVSNKNGGCPHFLTPTHQQLDLENQHQVQSYLHEHGPDAIIHAAGCVGGILANVNSHVEFLVRNSRMSLNLLEAARNAGILRLLQVGSSCMYPRDRVVELRELDLLTGPLEPTNEGYALAKILSTRLLEYIRQETGYAYVTFVACNLFGPGDSFDLYRGHLLASAIRKIDNAVKNGATHVDIWGTGNARREFLFVDDFSRFILDALPRLACFPGTVNVGLGRDYSVLAYYRMVAEIVGFSGDFTTDPSKPSGMARKLMDISIAKSLGWSPAYDIPAGIKETWTWYLHNE